MSTSSATKGKAAISGKVAILAVLLGGLSGLGLYTFNYAEGTAYFSNDPKACLNCHVMREPFDGWSHSSHKAVAACNDCHSPRDFPDNWLAKGVNGWNHSVAFTSGNFQDPIRIREYNSKIVQENCVACHQRLVSVVHRSSPRQERSCISCHVSVGHGG